MCAKNGGKSEKSKLKELVKMKAKLASKIELGEKTTKMNSNKLLKAHYKFYEKMMQDS